MFKDKQVCLEKVYVQACESAKVEPQKSVFEALKTCSSTGELHLPSINLNVWSWQTLAKIIGQTVNIKKLNISNCLIPPRGLAALFAALCQGSSIEDLDMRGNNIQTTSVSHLGKMMRYNVSLKRICLEWNSLGVFLETFTLFCDGLASNQILEVLDIRNNQIGPDCAGALANALARNSVLKALDMRWNNVGWKGGQLLYAAVNNNTSLTKIKLQGNCIPMELTLAIEQQATHNATRAALLEECSQRTDLLSHQLRKAEEDRIREIQGLSRHSEEKLQQIMQASEARVSQMEKQLLDKDERILQLEKDLQAVQEEVHCTVDQMQRLQLQLREREATYQQLVATSRKEVDDLGKQLAEKAEEILDARSDAKTILLTEQKRRLALEAMHTSQSEEVARLEAELVQAKERLVHAAKQHADAIDKEKASAREQVAAASRDGETQLAQMQLEMTSMRNMLRMRVSELERTVEELEHVRSELSGSLSKERARRGEEVTQAAQEAKLREASRVNQLEERLAAAREDRLQLEKQLSQMQSQVMQLQQQNSSLIAELAEPQRKLNMLHEELSAERVTGQRMRQELAEEQSRAALRAREAERLQTDVEALHTRVADLTQAQRAARAELERDRQAMQQLLNQRDREIDNIRAQEIERANVLYSAFNKYLSSVTPVRTQLPVSPRVLNS